LKRYASDHPEAAQKRSENLKGRKLSNDTKQRMSQSRMGMKRGPMGEELKRKLIEITKTRTGDLHQFYGKYHTEDAKLKMRIAWLARKIADCH
jgi:hypothetical protein